MLLLFSTELDVIQAVVCSQRSPGASNHPAYSDGGIIDLYTTLICALEMNPRAALCQASTLRDECPVVLGQGMLSNSLESHF